MASIGDLLSPALIVVAGVVLGLFSRETANG